MRRGGQVSPIWRNRLIAVAAVLLALVGAFSAGRFSAPLKTETRDVERVVFKDKVVEVEKVVTVREAARVETKIVWRDRVILKDGTVTEHEVEKTADAETSKVSVVDNTERTATLSGERVTEHTTTVTLRPSWRVALLAGASLHGALLPIASTGPVSLVLGVEVDYRIVGGLSVGLWVNTVGAAGLALSFEF